VGVKGAVLGVDPGFGVTGYGILTAQAGHAEILDCGYLKLSSKKHLSVRVSEFYDFFCDIIEKRRATVLPITHVAIETSFLGKNAQVFLKLGYLRGILYLVANKNNLDISEFPPRTVKNSVTGYGGAGKDQVAFMLHNMFPRLKDFGATLRNDVTDAVAIALCGVWNQKDQELAERIKKAESAN
jgi:crossover junction endodeoxyribonuclease RuvC